MVSRASTTRGKISFAVIAALALAALGAAPAPAARDGQGGLSAAPKAAPATAEGMRPAFPVRGRFAYWDGMGAGRGHQGVDLGARCGTPLVAALPGRVRYVKYHARGGNYVVLDVEGSPLDLVYMHLRERARVRPGQSVGAGTALGRVGETGNASGCHLHFEVWDGAYYRGGAPVDPMPYLSTWERESRRAARRARR